MKKNIRQGALALMLTAGSLASLLTGCASTGNASEKTAETFPKKDPVELLENGLTKKTDDGVILHAWCWNFNTIKENMGEIAAAGYSAVQTSPIMKCRVGSDNKTPALDIAGTGAWWYHYQPTEYVVGNYQLGTEAEFKAMCEEAHKYGVKVIVDSVLNHCTSEYEYISPRIKALSEKNNPKQDLFHDMTKGGWRETDRYLETQRDLSGLWDWNTQNPVVQNYLQNFLKTCVKDGADGFRFDAAKLVELPDDTSATYGNSFASNFWPVVLQNGSTFQYGEVLQEGGAHLYSPALKAGGYDDNDSSRLATYHKIRFGEEKEYNLHTTGSFYGMRVRDAVSFRNVSVSFVSDYLLPKGVNPNNIVTWVESHDNYCNDASYKKIDEQQAIQAWAIVAGRSAGTPLFFDRPMGSSSTTPWGENKVGPAGSDMYRDAQVVAVNFFHNDMGNEDEALSNPNGDTSVLMIERGKKGFIIVNTKKTDVLLDGASMLTVEDGTYTDQVYGGSFTVADGKLKGSVKAGKVAVVYNRTGSSTAHKFKPAVSVSKASQNFATETITVELVGRGVSTIGYRINDGRTVPGQNGESVVLGQDLKNNEKVKLTVFGYDENGKTVAEKSFEYTKEVYLGNTIVAMDPAAFPGWKQVYLYAYYNNGERMNASWPGVKMKNENGVWTYVLPFGLEDAIVIFNNGSGGNGNQYEGITVDGENSIREENKISVSKGEKKILTREKEWKLWK